ncbi:hypothetical protein, partial [Streptomyces sp. NPDC001435]|uniref:hypothetical protein n=1 Tax=Streptomyces sp. NPDC001435 TaxID=3364576 RepID=UPI00368E1993
MLSAPGVVPGRGSVLPGLRCRERVVACAGMSTGAEHAERAGGRLGRGSVLPGLRCRERVVACAGMSTGAEHAERA